MQAPNEKDEGVVVSSSSNTETDNLDDALSNFRDAWQNEIKKTGAVNTSSDQDNEDVETQAKEYFMLGAENERTGHLYEAIQNYRKAVQLVPDIEFKIFNSSKKQVEEKNESSPTATDEMENEIVSDENEDELEDTMDLCNRFQSLYLKSCTVCVPAQEQKESHLSSLPMEIILLIFRWVVSKEVDVRSLEMCSMVCRGFYVCSRDSEIWKHICYRAFGTNCMKLDNSASWRDTYLQKPHLQFNGCYISKATYFRQGDKCFQDQFHRPWHVVEYYRYLRFFADGIVLMITTPDGPSPILNYLRHRQPKNPAVLVGRFWISDDRVSMAFQRNNIDHSGNRRRARLNRQSPDYIEQKYNIDLALKAQKSRGFQLVWTRYTVYTTRAFTETMSNFDLPPSKFPPFWFSRVKSYSLESESQL